MYQRVAGLSRAHRRKRLSRREMARLQSGEGGIAALPAGMAACEEERGIRMARTGNGQDEQAHHIIRGGSVDRRPGGRAHGQPGRIAACFLAGALFGALPCALYSHAYFRDDVQAKFMPMLVALGAAFRHGEWVPLTLQSWAGRQHRGRVPVRDFQSAIAGELCRHQPDRAIWAVGIACLVAFYDGMLAAGTYVLARRCGADRPWALIARRGLRHQQFHLLLAGEPLITGLISFAWLVWALAFLLEAGRSRFRWLLATLAMALTIDAGWQYGAPVLGIMTLILAGGDVVRGDRRAAAARLLALAAAGLLTLCTLLPGPRLVGDVGPAVRHRQYQLPCAQSLWRAGAVQSRLSRLHADLRRAARYLGTGSSMPGWYLLPLLPLIAWRRLSLSRPMLWSLGLFGAIMLLATQGPEQLGLVRWSFRFVPYFQLAVVLMVSLAASDAGFAAPSRRRVAAALGLVALSAVGAWQAHPEGWAGEALLGAIMAGVTLYIAPVPRDAHRDGGDRHALPVPGDARLVPRQSQRAGMAGQFRVTSIVDLEAVPSSYSLYLGTLFEPDFGRQDGGPGRARPWPRGDQRLFDLSPSRPCRGALHGDGRRHVRQGGAGADAARSGDRDATRRSAAGRSADRAEGPAFPTPASHGRTTDETETSATYERDAPADRPPGSVAWATPGMTLKETIAATPTEERIDVTAPGTAGERRILFARAFWPGYAATLDGATLAVKPYRDLLVAVDMPAGVTAGTLVLRYSPPFATAGAIAAALALLLMFLVWGFGPGRLFRAANRRGRPGGSPPACRCSKRRRAPRRARGPLNTRSSSITAKTIVAANSASASSASLRNRKSSDQRRSRMSAPAIATPSHAATCSGLRSGPRTCSSRSIL